MSRLQLLEPDAHKLINAVSEQVFDEVYNRLRNRRTTLIKRIQSGITYSFQNSPTVNSMLSGRLKGELGLDAATAEILARILYIINDAVRVSITIQRRSLSLSFQFGFAAGAYEELFVDGTTFTSTNGYEIEWLKWLLELGDDIIVTEFRYKEGAFEGYSRSGEGIMIKNRGGIWRVPPEFSGTEERNFITKLFDNVEQEIFSYVNETIQG